MSDENEVEIEETEAPEAPEAAEASAEEKQGDEVAVEPAHTPAASIKVRGTAVGGVKTMTADEHKKYCEDEAKKAK